MAGGSVVGAGFALSRDAGRRPALQALSALVSRFRAMPVRDRRSTALLVLVSRFRAMVVGGWRGVALSALVSRFRAMAGQRPPPGELAGAPRRCWCWFRAFARWRSEAGAPRCVGGRSGEAGECGAGFFHPGTGPGRRGPGLLFPATIPPGRRGVAQSGRAPGSGSGGRRFKSCRPDAARPPDGFRQTGSGPEAAAASGAFGRIPSRPFPPGNRAVTSALTHGSKRVYSGALAGDSSSRRVPVFLPLLLDIPKSGVMKLARMFAPSAPVHSTVRVHSEPYFAGFLPLDPVAHILAARLAGAGTRRFALSYRRWE